MSAAKHAGDSMPPARHPSLMSGTNQTATACPAAASQAPRSKLSAQRMKGQELRKEPGAVLVAISEASIRKVPEPHIRSTSTAGAAAVQGVVQHGRYSVGIEHNIWWAVNRG